MPLTTRTTVFLVLLSFLPACLWSGERSSPDNVSQSQIGNEAAQEKMTDSEFPRTRIRLGDQIIEVELAETPSRQAQGLMHRKSMDWNTGMLFVFQDEDYRGFWMKNTLINLSIGFFDRNRQLLQVKEMTPQGETPEHELPIYRSREPAKYALEMNQNWFRQNKIKLGETFEFLDERRESTK